MTEWEKRLHNFACLFLPIKVLIARWVNKHATLAYLSWCHRRGRDSTVLQWPLPFYSYVLSPQAQNSIIIRLAGRLFVQDSSKPHYQTFNLFKQLIGVRSFWSQLYRTADFSVVVPPAPPPTLFGKGPLYCLSPVEMKGASPSPSSSPCFNKSAPNHRLLLSLRDWLGFSLWAFPSRQQLWGETSE